MKKKKIVIISRNVQDYSNEHFALGAALKNRSENMSNTYYQAYEELRIKARNDNEKKRKEVLEKGGEYEDDEFSAVEDWLTAEPSAYSRALVDLFVNGYYTEEGAKKIINLDNIKEGTCNLKNIYKKGTFAETTLYQKTTIDTKYEVYLFYYDRTKEKLGNKRIWEMMALICKDCEIDLNSPIPEPKDKHILYIHDDEWGCKGDQLLMKDSIPQPLYQKDHDNILDQLKDYFSYVATFEHVNSPGRYFHNILNCNFGENVLDEIDDVENNNQHGDFVNLMNEIVNLLKL